MKRLLLDTCIYGELSVDKDLERIKEVQARKKEWVIYGFSLIRKELRATSKSKRFFGKNLRIAMLSLYDEWVKDRTLRFKEDKILEIARKYYVIYLQLGGTYSEAELLGDYLIVACASLKGMDLVVSEDHATLLSDWSRKAYALVNKVHQLREPEFMGYKKFKALLLQESHGEKYDGE